MASPTSHFVQAAPLAAVQAAGCLPVRLAGQTLALIAQGERIYAIDNRCPHMGFPLHRGSCHDGILTCHWHHARFDLASGGTFDPWADDVPAFPVEIRGDAVWVDVSPRADPQGHLRRRLDEGLERNLALVIAKAAVGLLAGGLEPTEPFRQGLAFGVRYRQQGWGQGLTILTGLMNLLPYLAPADRPRALYHGLAAVARDCDGTPARFVVRPLPSLAADVPTLTRWFRRFVAVRDAEGAERCLVSAVRAGASPAQLATMLFVAATDYRYLTVGHVLDFTNKAFEALAIAGWEQAEPVLASLIPAYASATRMEESSAWRHPVDLIALLEPAFAELPQALAAGRQATGPAPDPAALTDLILEREPAAIVAALLAALRQGQPPERVAASVTAAAGLRIARFPTSNEFGDWDTALHTFTFANAVHQALLRLGPLVAEETGALVVRGVFDAAMSVYLDRFLNVPPARLPETRAEPASPALLDELTALLDQRQAVDTAGALVAHYCYGGGAQPPLLARLGGLLLREDRDFHTIQMVEATVRQATQAPAAPQVPALLVAAMRYLAAHAPTMRAQGQTYQIAERLARGERLVDDPTVASLADEDS